MNDANHTQSVVQRRHTSPQAKWLLNEAAALRGELARVIAEQQRLATRESEIRKTLAALELVAAPLPVPAGIDAPVCINGHHRYGPRGTLTRLLLELLDASYPKGVDTLTLVSTIADKLGISIATVQERNRYRWSIVNRLRHLADQGKVERLPGLGAHDVNSVGVWRRLRAKPTPSLEALRLAAGSAATKKTPGGI